MVAIIVVVFLLSTCAATRRWLSGGDRDDPASSDVWALTRGGGVSPSGEAQLVTGLLAGELPPTQYREAMARLAIEDDLRHPLTVPPEGLGRET